MGFNRRYITFERCLEALEKNNIKGYYGKSDSLIFTDQIISDVFKLFKEGKNEQEILLIIKKRMEEKTYEMY